MEEEAPTGSDNIVTEFNTYEDFLDSQITSLDLYYLEVHNVLYTLFWHDTMRVESQGGSQSGTTYPHENWTFACRRGYLGSTLLACRAVAPPHIKLEICIKHIFHTNMYTQLFPQPFCHIFFNKSQHANIVVVDQFTPGYQFTPTPQFIQNNHS